MARPNPHSAVESALGYYYQGMYALLVLFDAPDDDARVSIETGDDVELQGGEPTLFQLKHKSGDPPNLTVRSTDLWKTLSIWATSDHRAISRFILVTGAGISQGSSLEAFFDHQQDRSAVLQDLRSEALRVLEEREVARTGGKIPLPHADRATGCEKFHNLSPEVQEHLIDRILILPGSFSIRDIDTELERRLRPISPAHARHRVVGRVLEWWDRRVVMSLLERWPREIHKIELQEVLTSILLEQTSSHLPDQYSDSEPDSLEDEYGELMAKQILLVKGGRSRINRAARVRWQARKQRDRWMEDDYARASELIKYDAKLKRAWGDKFGPMRDDCADGLDERKCDLGRQLLDWSHEHAPRDIPPIRSGWVEHFFVQGSFQQLAEELEIGWHPDWENTFKPAGDNPGIDEES